MRILFLTTGYPGLTTRSYGLGNALAHTASALAARGHEVHVQCETGRRATTTVDGVVCHEFELGRHLPDRSQPYTERSHRLFMHSDKHLAELYQHWCEYVHLVRDGFRPEIIDAPDYRALGYYLVHHRRLGYPEACAPILTTCHSNRFAMWELDRDLSYSWPNLQVQQREKAQLIGADAVVAVSHFMADRLAERYHLPRPRVYHPCSRHAEPANLLPPCTNNELLYTGQICYLKGILTLLRVCAHLWDDGSDFVLKLMGLSQPYALKDTDLVAHIRHLYRTHIEQGRLRVLPHSNDFETIKRELRESRAVVLPTLMESFSLTCVEGMSYGRPVVASCNGGHTELIEHGRSGLIYSSDSELEQSLKTVLAASRSKLEAWGRNSNQRVCELASIESSLPVYEQICADVIAEARTKCSESFPAAAFADRRRFATVPEPQPVRASENNVPGLLHVVIPCFNLGRYVEEAAISVLRSSYRPIRLSVVDDASTDAGTRATFDALSARYRSSDGLEIAWRREPRNLGPAAIRTGEAERSNAELLCFVDADDRVRHDYFERAAALLRRYPNLGFVGGWVELFGARSFNWITSEIDLPLFLLRNQAIGPSVIRRCAWPGQALDLLGEDYDGFLSMLEHGWIGANLPEVVYEYRARSDSHYHGATANEQRIMATEIARRHPSLYRLFAEDIVAILAQNYLYGTLRPRPRLASWRAARACRVKSALSICRIDRRRIWSLPATLARLMLPLETA